MVIKKDIHIFEFLKGQYKSIIVLIGVISGIALLYYFKIINFSLPWLPVSVIGTAVAFYVGFKNNQAYDRMWEARKIWGGIVNDSRTWGMMVDGYVTNIFNKEKLSKEELYTIKKRLIYRHIGWLYAHRSQLLVATPWEHVSQSGRMEKNAKKYQKKFGIGLVDDEVTRIELKHFLPEKEYGVLVGYSNTATQIINQQSKDLSFLREQDIIDDFRHMEMENILREFYALQGKNERIKKFPLPRQYANLSRYFTNIFIFLLPFSMIPQLMTLGDIGIWLSIPVTVIIAWVYLTMEVIGDFSENPFQGMAYDIPMLSLCRTIEIDLREMLKETDLPKPIEAKNHILM